MFLVNVTDGERLVSYEEGLHLATLMHASYFEVSVESGTNCEQLFINLANSVIDCKQAYCEGLNDLRT